MTDITMDVPGVVAGRIGLRPHAGRVRHVLVCLDRSSSSESCLPHARMIAGAFGAKMTLLHVMPSLDGASREWSRPDALEWEIRRLEAAQYLQAVRARVDTGDGVVATELAQGPAAERIVATARDVGADLTILATHGEGGDRETRLGSTTHRVLALSTGSVLLTRTSTEAVVPPARIVVPLDGSARTETVLPTVAALAGSYGASVVLLHAVREPQATAMLSELDDLPLARALATRIESSAERYLAQLRERLLADVPDVLTRVVRRTDPRGALLEAATELRGDLVVMAAHGSTCDAAQPYGSVAAYLLAHSRIPLLVLQDAPIGDAGRYSEPPRHASGIRSREGL